MMDFERSLWNIMRNKLTLQLNFVDIVSIVCNLYGTCVFTTIYLISLRLIYKYITIFIIDI